jgi:hypothetical protein
MGEKRTKRIKRKKQNIRRTQLDKCRKRSHRDKGSVRERL